MIPNVSENNGFWEGTILLDSWCAFFKEENPLSLKIGGDRLVKEISETHKSGYDYLIKNQETILRSLLGSLKKIYPKLQKKYDFDEEEMNQYMPDISDEDDFVRLIRPHTIFIHDVAKDGIPYIGFQFDCVWDDEHGLGAMTHCGNIVEIADADTGFLSWVAEKDLDQ